MATGIAEGGSVEVAGTTTGAAATYTSVAVSPPAPSLTTGTQQFTAVASGTGPILQTFTWSKLSGVGSIDNSGLYTPPAQTGVVQNAVIQALAADGTTAGTANISIAAFSALPPTISSAVISADGKTLALVFSSALQNNVVPRDFFLSNASGFSGHSLSSDGLTLSLTLRRPAFAGEAPTLAYSSTSAIGVNGAALASFSGRAVTNNSARLTLAPPANFTVNYPLFDWSAVTGATGYRVYANGIQQYDSANAAGANTLTHFTSTVASDGRPVDQPTFTVSAYNGSGESPQSGTSNGVAAQLLGQAQQSVTLIDGSTVNGQIVRFNGPQRVMIDDTRYDLPIGIPVSVPASVKLILQQAGLV